MLAARPSHLRQLVRHPVGAFKRVGGLDDATFVVEVADELEADGEAFGGEAARDADGGQAGD